MEENQFQQLLKAVNNEDIWHFRMSAVKEILTELLEGEFKDKIEERKFKIILKELKDRSLAKIHSKDGQVYLFINLENWEKNANFSKSLRGILRHELLHLETGQSDQDLDFRIEAKRRGIDIWNV